MSQPLLCATVAASSIEDLRRQRDEASRIADLVELRLDALAHPDVDGALEGRKGPVMVTCRPRWEGGGFDGSEEVRLGLLRRALERGAEFVDVEWRAADEALLRGRRGRGVVLSSHDFTGTPPDLRERFRAMAATGAEVVKLAVTARALGDCLQLRELARAGGDVAGGPRTALVAMGPKGLATRVLPGRFGSCWSYAGDSVAPGQVPARRLLEEFRFRETTDATALFAVAGEPVFHSLSPAIHNAAFLACGLDAVYLPLESDDADDFLGFARALGFSGASVTIPLKMSVLRRVADVDATSREVGALNTLRWSAGRWVGRNTDVEGFLAPLEAEKVRGARAAVLGCGGAARAVVAGLRSRGAAVVVYGRDSVKAAAVAKLFGVEGRGGVPAPGSWDVLVNATPVGAFPDPDATPMPGADFRGGRLVYDLVYNPQDTRLLRDAAAAGCRTIGGLAMLVAQAALQFAWWTGRRAPVERMQNAALARLRAMTGAA